MSVGVDGDPANGASFGASLSADGRFVAFQSEATNLVPGDTNGVADVFVRDLQTNTTERVSVGPNGVQADAYSYGALISADGRIVIFNSQATNLGAGAPATAYGNVYAYDRTTGQVTFVSADYSSRHISSDARFVALADVPPYAPGETNDVGDILVIDRTTGAIERASVASDGTQANGFSDWAGISADGRWVSFHSYATNLVPNDTNAKPDVFVHDRQTGATTRVSVSSSGAEANAASTFASLSPDGRFVLFQSAANDLAPGDTNAVVDYFLHDRQTGTTTRLVLGATDTGSPIGGPAFSGDGNLIAFYSSAADFVANDTNGVYDVFVYDRSSGVTSRVSTGAGGVQGNGQSWISTISSDGATVAFASTATNLVSNDANGPIEDVFVRRLTCGNGVLDAGEACDDGNDADCDGCSAHCTVETGCGDGVLCGAETCDDGNTNGGDGCSATCTVEPLDLSGSWQMTTEFTSGASAGTTATLFFTFAEGTAGAFTATPDECGSFVLGNTIHELESCSPTPVAGQRTGTDFALPATGSSSIDETVASPFFYAPCSVLPAERILGAMRLTGRVQTIGGRAVRITGAMVLRDVDVRDTSGATCISIPGQAVVGTFEMLRDDVAAGEDVTVQPRRASTITFDSVDAPGHAGITALTATGDVPANFEMVGASVYYEVRSTASVGGDITTCLPYPDADQDGIVDGTNPPLAEGDLQLLHAENGTFVDRTVSRDPVGNRICAATTSLSPFFLGAPTPPTTTSTSISTTSTTSTSTSTTLPPPGTQLINGRRISVKDNAISIRRALSAESRDPAIGLGGGNATADDPVVTGGSTVRVRTADGCGGPCDTTYPLESPGVWSYIGTPGNNRGYRYKDRTGLIRSVTVKPGAQVKVSAKGRLGQRLGADPKPVDVVVQMAGRRYCMQFGGTTTRFVVGKTFVAVVAPAPAACPP